MVRVRFQLDDMGLDIGMGQEFFQFIAMEIGNPQGTGLAVAIGLFDSRIPGAG